MVFDETLERMILLSIVLEFLDRSSDLGNRRPGGALLQQNNALSVGIGEWLEQDSVNCTEKCRVSAYTERKRKARQQRIFRVAPKNSEAILQVLKKGPHFIHPH